MGSSQEPVAHPDVLRISRGQIAGDAHPHGWAAGKSVSNNAENVNVFYGNFLKCFADSLSGEILLSEKYNLFEKKTAVAFHFHLSYSKQ